jgi:hypothetical protein
MPHRNKSRTRVRVAGHHIGLNQSGSNGVHGDSVSNTMPTNLWLSTVKIALSWLGTRIRGGRLCLTDMSVFRGMVSSITAGFTAVNVTQVFRVCRFLDDHSPTTKTADPEPAPVLRARSIPRRRSPRD